VIAVFSDVTPSSLVDNCGSLQERTASTFKVEDGFSRPTIVQDVGKHLTDHMASQ
jgi:hypothetical protein